MTNIIRVAVPLGVGDAHWSAQKFKALKAHHGGAELHVHINECPDHKTVGYMQVLAEVDVAIFDKMAPNDIHRQLAPYKDPKWATLAGTKGWNGFDYVIIPNGWVEEGRHMDDFYPELETEYMPELRISEADQARALDLMPEPRILLYPSGIGPNEGFHGGWWTPEDWATVVRMLNDAGVKPLFVGASTESDLGYYHKVEVACAGLEYDGIVGKTNLPQILAILQKARAWCGLNCGLGIVSASMKTPTVMFWADRRWRTGHPMNAFHYDMRTAWLPRSHELLTYYRTFSYGHPGFTAGVAVTSIIEIAR